MARRHGHTPGDWASVATRLEEIVAAECGGDAFDELFKLLVARLVSELDEAKDGTRGGAPDRTAAGASADVAGLLREAAERWPDVLDESTTRLDPSTVRRCLEVLRGMSLLGSSLMGLDLLFEFVTSRASKGAKGQFFTPRHVVHEAIRMLDVQPGESVCDPACGSGAFLVHALLEQPDAQVSGADLDPRAARNARVMLAALGQDPSRVRVCDSLDPASHDGQRYDVVATNPPFAGDVGPRYRGH